MCQMTDLDKNSIWGASLLDEEINKSAIVHISERISIGEELDALAFLEKPDEQDCETYAVLDPTLRKAVTGIFDLDTVDAEARSLFDGRAAEQNEETAPYLVDATVRSTNQIPIFNRKFLKEHWGKSTGIIVRSRGSFDEVRKHFRRFTKLRREEGNGWFFFRFWDPRIASVYFRTVQHSRERAEQWFGRGLIDSFVIEERGGRQATTFRAASSFEPSNQPLRSVVLTDWELRPFRVSAYERDVERIAKDLKKDFEAELTSYSTENIVNLILPTIARFWGIGFRRKEYLYVIAAWGVFYGSNFIEKDPLGTLGSICTSDLSEKAKFAALKARMAEFGNPGASL